MCESFEMINLFVNSIKMMILWKYFFFFVMIILYYWCKLKMYLCEFDLKLVDFLDFGVLNIVKMFFL